ncbi:hypothetical protein BB561_003505 [Smittium simulii]|uniref:Uncharacterized protein n=1 Tax=Smittium simulii TaxID=133385 RepID=A0A2T9YKY0_9FUNG|nr:hypothetical protein BB561_003505 [Smittium simulii]
MEKDAEEFSCKTSEALDQLFYCWTLGKQVKNVYRYGSKKDCSKYWEKVKLCSKIKLMSDENKTAAIKAHLDKNKQETLSQPNLLDIWTERSSKLENFPPVTPA